MDEQTKQRVISRLDSETLYALFAAVDRSELCRFAKKLGMEFPGHRFSTIPAEALAEAITDEFLQNDDIKEEILQLLDDTIESKDFENKSEKEIRKYARHNLMSDPEKIIPITWTLLKADWDSDRLGKEVWERVYGGFNKIEEDIEKSVTDENVVLRQELSIITKKLTKAREEYARTHQMAAKAEAKASGNETEVNQLREENEKLRGEIKNIQEEEKTLKIKLKDRQTDTEAKNKVLEQKVEDVRAQLLTTQSKLDHLARLKRVGIFVDGENLYYQAKTHHKGKVNYQALLEYFAKAKGRFVADAYMYLVEVPGTDQEKFSKFLKQIGYTVKYRPSLQRADGTMKANWDLGMGLEILQRIHRYDIVILVTGDGDFVDLINHIKKYYDEVRVEVASFVAERTSKRLIRAADCFYQLDEKLITGDSGDRLQKANGTVKNLMRPSR